MHLPTFRQLVLDAPRRLALPIAAYPALALMHTLVEKSARFLASLEAFCWVVTATQPLNQS